MNTLVQYLEISPERIFQSPIFSYLSDFTGIVLGFAYDGQIFVRDFSNDELGPYVNVTVSYEELCAKIVKKENIKKPLPSIFDYIN